MQLPLHMIYCHFLRKNWKMVPLAPAAAQKQKEAAQPVRPQTLLSACFAEKVSAASRPENLAAQNANPLQAAKRVRFSNPKFLL